jgi:hypothetical protein
MGESREQGFQLSFNRSLLKTPSAMRLAGLNGKRSLNGMIPG